MKSLSLGVARYRAVVTGTRSSCFGGACLSYSPPAPGDLLEEAGDGLPLEMTPRKRALPPATGNTGGRDWLQGGLKWAFYLKVSTCRSIQDGERAAFWIGPSRINFGSHGVLSRHWGVGTEWQVKMR